MNNNYSHELADLVNNFLVEDDWNFTFDEENGNFQFNLRVDSQIRDARYIVSVKEDSLLTFCLFPIFADNNNPAQMAELAEFFCRINFHLKNGCWELDFQDGEIRFKTYVDCDDLYPSRAVISNSIFCPAAMFKRYCSGILEIMFGGMNAVDALEHCENPSLH